MAARASAALALIAALIAIFTVPGATIGAGLVSDTTSAVQQTAATVTEPVQEPVQQVAAPVQETVQQVVAPVQQVTAPAPEPAPAATAPVQQLTAPVQEAVGKATEPVEKAVEPEPAARTTAPAQTRQEAQDPATEPALHGTNPHGQGTVGVVDVNPSDERPQSGDTTGEESGEEVVVGRSRGEQQDDGSYRGRITIAALLGNEILGVQTSEGETRAGPLDPVQQAVLDPICDGSDNQLCLEVLAADSTTTENGSTNRFAVASARAGGAEGLSVGAAESRGSIADDGTCQQSEGSSRVANVSAGGTAVADVAQSSSTTRACRGQDTQTTQSSQVLALGGTAVPLPAEGCGEGTPDTVTGIPTLAPIVCNASEEAANGGVRHALDVFVLQAGGSSLVQISAAQAESVAVAPAADDGTTDDGGDGTTSAGAPAPTPTQGPGAGGGPGDGTTGAGAPDGDDGPGDGDDGGPIGPSGDPGDDGPGAGGPGDRPECSDGIDNDGDGRIDFPADPDCTSRSDDSEAPAALRSGLPFTGADAVSLALAGLLVLAGGVLLRRRATAAG